MNGNGALVGTRVLLSGSVPDDSPHKAAIEQFVQSLASGVLREGGTLIHGSHPSLIEPLRVAAVRYIQADVDYFPAVRYRFLDGFHVADWRDAPRDRQIGASHGAFKTTKEQFDEL